MEGKNTLLSMAAHKIAEKEGYKPLTMEEWRLFVSLHSEAISKLAIKIKLQREQQGEQG